MRDINQDLYINNAFYHDLVNKMQANEQEKRRLQMERDRLQAEQDAYYLQQMMGYANQIPYSCMTPVSPYQWAAPYATMQDNFVSYWEQVREQKQLTQQQRAAQQENLRRAFRLAADVSALACKQSPPVASIVFEGIGLLTAGNLLEAAKSVVSIIDTAQVLPDRRPDGRHEK